MDISIALLVGSMAVMLAGGLAALACGTTGSNRTASLFGAGGTIAGAIMGLAGAGRLLWLERSADLHLDWSIPYGSFALKADALSAFFLVPILFLAALAALYGVEYMRAYEKEKPLGPAWFFFNLLIANMVLVVLAANAMLFLMAWEIMSLASFFLVTFEHEQARVRQAGWIYLVATHIGTIALFVLFLSMAREAGSMDFERFAAAGFSPGTGASLFFVLALIGFGTKAGIAPFHVWLPEAHPVAPSHVSAVMSGVMIKTGIYGLLRTMTFLGPPPAWWGLLLLGIGIGSGLLGIVFALAQQDMKRLLAYSSVENVGIIFIGLGLGTTGLSCGSTAMAALGFAGALFHLLNHSVFKGLLFLGAGSVLHATHTLAIEQLGGLLKRMPVTGTAFMFGAAAICGLPPFNGFAGELLIYLGAFKGTMTHIPGVAAGASLAAIGSLALIGGLAAACFAKVFGIAFLGEPRSLQAERAHDPGAAMRVPLAILASLCVLIGLLSPLVLSLMGATVTILTRGPEWTPLTLFGEIGTLFRVSAAGAIVILLVAALAVARKRLLRSRAVESGMTWDCGYAQPSARMQYTASSFSQPMVDFFRGWLRTKKKTQPITDLFPQTTTLQTATPDVVMDRLYRPLFVWIGSSLARLQRMQSHSLHLCILYIAVTLVALLIWKLA